MKEFPKKIEAADINCEMPQMGGTKIIHQRHERYVTSAEDEKVGSLTPESAEKAKKQSEQLFADMLDSISEEERDKVDVLVIGSTTTHHGKGQRTSWFV